MVFRITAFLLFFPVAVFASPPAVLPPSPSVLIVPVAPPAFTLPLTQPISFTPAHTPLAPLAPLARPALVPAPPAPDALAYQEAAAVIARWNASVANPAQRVYLHPDAAHFTLTLGGDRALHPSSYPALWAVAMRPGVALDKLSSADQAAMRAFANRLSAYQAEYRAVWEKANVGERPASRPSDPLQAALWELDERMVAINAPGDPRRGRPVNEFLRSVDMKRLVDTVRTVDIDGAGETLPKMLWRLDLSLVPITHSAPSSPRAFLILDNQTGRSLSLPDYIAAGFPERIK